MFGWVATHSAVLTGALIAALISTLVPMSARAAYDGELRWSAHQFATTASSIDASLSAANGSLDTSAIASLDASAEPVVRLESTWKADLGDSSKQLRLGDTVSNPGEWGSAVRFAGMQFSTGHVMRSDLIGSQRLALSGIAVVPSTVDAVLSAHRAKSKVGRQGLHVASAASVDPNRFAFTLQDAAGRSINVARPLLATNEQRPTGCRDVSLGVGFARKNYGLVSNSYGPMFANSTISCGVNARLSLEVHDEYLAGDANIAGIDVLHSLGHADSAGVAVATSRNELGSGWLVRMSWRHSTEVFDLNLRARAQSSEFRELGQAEDSDALARRMLATFGSRLSEHSKLVVTYAKQVNYTDEHLDIMMLSQTLELGRRGTFSIGAARSVGADADASIKLAYVRPL